LRRGRTGVCICGWIRRREIDLPLELRDLRRAWSAPCRDSAAEQRGIRREDNEPIMDDAPGEFVEKCTQTPVTANHAGLPS
jgi:hypothetical protein